MVDGEGPFSGVLSRVHLQLHCYSEDSSRGASIKDIERRFTHNDPTSGHLLQEKRMELSTFLREQVMGTLVRSCFLYLEEMDAPSSFFFNLERSVARRKQIACF